MKDTVLPVILTIVVIALSGLSSMMLMRAQTTGGQVLWAILLIANLVNSWLAGSYWGRRL